MVEQQPGDSALMSQLDWARGLNPNPFKTGKVRHRITVEEAHKLQERRLLAQHGVQVIGRM